MSRSLPSSLRTTRILLYIMAGLYGAMAAVGLYIGGMDPAMHAKIVWNCWPGVFPLIFALRLPRGGRLLMWSIVVLQVLWILQGLAVFVSGDLAGLTRLLLPVLILVYVLKKSSREFFSPG